ncbi:hypothetical protein U2F26_13665 [Micromonospora sp. 4G57]|uniref:Uncharacterized protein n=1 Tax=Micromonospora sicca TaxID=2202420 RepID=A0ABU5JB02_9ACTN|nr:MULTISPECIES: hypothetical protein [unclassified Micromonospora]MDZ5443771.1 hypothetical protein [Micromonospora sp. 4G57]MDZ5489711.1 hypothetical protein [Micromonospora sp. 4G53]
MDDQLTQAARAYRDALAEESEAKEALAAAKLRREEAGRAVNAARGPLADAIVARARAGMRQVDILDAIENVYTRETVRRICRAAGVEPGE